MNASWLRGSPFDRLTVRWRERRQRGEEPIDIFGTLGTASSILIAPNDRVGGLTLGTPVYKLVRQHYPEARLELLVAPRQVSLAEQLPFFDAVRAVQTATPVWSAAFAGAARDLRQGAFDLVLSLGADCSFRLAYLIQCSGGRLRVGFRRPGLQPYNVEIIPSDETRYEGQQYAHMLRMLGMEGDGEVRWALASEGVQQVQARYLDDGDSAGRKVAIDLSRGGGGGLSNRQLDDIVGRVVERGVRVIVFFTLSERKVVQHLTATYGRRVLPHDQEDLSQAAAMLQACDALIAGNTDLLHLALALRVPAVALFDEAPGRWIELGNERVQIIHGESLRHVSIGQVVHALDTTLSGRRHRGQAGQR